MNTRLCPRARLSQLPRPGTLKWKDPCSRGNKEVKKSQTITNAGPWRMTFRARTRRKPVSGFVSNLRSTCCVLYGQGDRHMQPRVRLEERAGRH